MRNQGVPYWNMASDGTRALGRVLAARAAIAEAIDSIADATDSWPALPSAEVAPVFGEAMRLRALTEGLSVALLIEAQSRGIIAESSWRKPADWVRAEATAADVPVPPSVAKRYEDVAQYAVRTDPDMSGYRAAVTSGALSVPVAASIRHDLDLITARVPGPIAATAIGAMVDAASTGASPGDLRAAREAVIASYGDEGEFEERQRHAYDHREMTAWRRDDHDRNVCSLALDNAGRAIVDAAMAALAAPLPTAIDEHGNVLERDLRTAAQRRADAFVEMCRVIANDPDQLGGVRPGNTAKAEVIVTMRLSRLVAGLGYDTDANGQPLPASAVRRLCCDAAIIPAVLGEAGELLDLGRESRLATRGQRRALAHRDRCCTFPGCTRPAGWCEAHHLVPWLDGGRTDLDNLALLCGHHHTVVHHKGYVGRVDADGAVQWARTNATALSPDHTDSGIGGIGGISGVGTISPTQVAPGVRPGTRSRPPTGPTSPRSPQGPPRSPAPRPARPDGASSARDPGRLRT